MKLILSRKGFDSSSGGMPSAIFPDNTIITFPIPDNNSSIRYGDIATPKGNLGNLVSSLSKGRIAPGQGAHLDPDVIRSSLPRTRGWKPLFGQSGQAQSHLRNNKVGPGDVFLFFGLFRRVESINGVFTWAKDTKPCHVIWGWMQVEKAIPLGQTQPSAMKWAHYHPHWHRENDSNNTLYTGTRQLHWNNESTSLPGTGVFTHYSNALQLTAPNAPGVSLWHVPSWLYPSKNRNPLTYHSDPKRWKKRKHLTELTAVARGQEFVLDCQQYPEAMPWVMNLIQHHRNPIKTKS